MENENKTCEHRGGCGKTMAIIAIILSVISIGLSAFTLGRIIIKNDQVNNNATNCYPCPMQNAGNCPMQNMWQNRWQNNMPMWPMYNNNNRMQNRTDNFWQRNDNTASSSNAKKKIGGYSPYNKAYDKKPTQDQTADQSPQEYKTFNAPDNTYGEKLKEREKLRREKRESIATRDNEETTTKETDTY